MADHRDTWVIVPVFNEAQVVGDVIRDLRAAFPNVVCVDDGSGDRSPAEIRRAGAHLVRHPVNLGQGAALQTGIEYARKQPGAQYFVTYDADGQHQVSDVLRMLHRLRTDDVDMVVGTRFHDGASRTPALKRVALKTAVNLSRRTRKLQLTDAHNGLRAFNKRVARQFDITLNGMAHASEILDLADRRGWRVVEEPVTILYTEYSLAKGQSLINGVNIVFDSVLRSSTRR